MQACISVLMLANLLYSLGIGDETMKNIILILVASTLFGCSWFQKKSEAEATDDVTVTQTCVVTIAEAAAVKGIADSDEMLYVSVKPDCTTVISTEQLEGDSVLTIEEKRTMPGSAPMVIPVPEDVTVYPIEIVPEVVAPANTQDVPPVVPQDGGQP